MLQSHQLWRIMWALNLNDDPRPILFDFKIYGATLNPSWIPCHSVQSPSRLKLVKPLGESLLNWEVLRLSWGMNTNNKTRGRILEHMIQPHLPNQLVLKYTKTFWWQVCKENEQNTPLSGSLRIRLQKIQILKGPPQKNVQYELN